MKREATTSLTLGARGDAERMYSGEWKSFIKERYGAEPSVTYFESPVIVDNASGVIQEG